MLELKCFSQLIVLLRLGPWKLGFRFSYRALLQSWCIGSRSGKSLSLWNKSQLLGLLQRLVMEVFPNVLSHLRKYKTFWLPTKGVFIYQYPWWLTWCLGVLSKRFPYEWALDILVFGSWKIDVIYPILGSLCFHPYVCDFKAVYASYSFI